MKDLDDSNQWDGSESTLVADDDAEQYEIPETGIKLSFSLTQEEMYKCLKKSDMYKTKGVRAIVQTLIFVSASLSFLVAYIKLDDEFKSMNLFFCIFCAVMTVLIWTVPYFHLKYLSKKMADGKTVNAEIYQERIDIGSGSGAWSIELDGSSELAEFDNMFMICTPKDQSFAIPQRIIEPELLNDVKAILYSGTKPKEDNQ